MKYHQITLFFLLVACGTTLTHRDGFDVSLKDYNRSRDMVEPLARQALACSDDRLYVQVTAAKEHKVEALQVSGCGKTSRFKRNGDGFQENDIADDFGSTQSTANKNQPPSVNQDMQNAFDSLNEEEQKH